MPFFLFVIRIKTAGDVTPSSADRPAGSLIPYLGPRFDYDGPDAVADHCDFAIGKDAIFRTSVRAYV